MAVASGLPVPNSCRFLHPPILTATLGIPALERMSHVSPDIFSLRVPLLWLGIVKHQNNPMLTSSTETWRSAERSLTRNQRRGTHNKNLAEATQLIARAIATTLMDEVIYTDDTAPSLRKTPPLSTFSKPSLR